MVSESEDFDLASGRDGFDFESFFGPPPIFSNAFKFFFVRRARFGGLSALVSIDVSNLRFRVWPSWICGVLEGIGADSSTGLGVGTRVSEVAPTGCGV